MTADEMRAARARLSLTVGQMAAELGLTPHVVEAMERGSVRVPRGIARQVAFRTAEVERDAVLAASGLPMCATVTALDAEAAGKQGEALIAAAEAIVAHARSCPTCRAQADYLAVHAPPMPEFPFPWWMRALRLLETLASRLPRPLRPADGEAGDGRRMGLFGATMFSAFAALVMAVFLIAGFSRAGFDSRLLFETLATLAIIVFSYFVGCYLAGWMVDLTRPIRHRLVGYVLRGALGMTALYGTVGLFMPLVDRSMSWRNVVPATAIFAAIGALAGMVLWVKDRVTDKLPTRVV